MENESQSKMIDEYNSATIRRNQAFAEKLEKKREEYFLLQQKKDLEFEVLKEIKAWDKEKKEKEGCTNEKGRQFYIDMQTRDILIAIERVQFEIAGIDRTIEECRQIQRDLDFKLQCEILLEEQRSNDIKMKLLNMKETGINISDFLFKI